MKVIFKWFLGLIVIATLITGLEMAKIALISPGPMGIEDHDGGPPPWFGGPPPPASFRAGSAEAGEHPEFGPPPSMEWKFALADTVNILIYAVALTPLLYIAYLFGKRAFGLPRFNTVTRTSAYTDASPQRNNEKSTGEQEAEATVTLSASDEYSLLDNHLLDQIL